MKKYSVWNAFVPATRALNGLGSTAKDWVNLLEQLTSQRGLRYLTMLRWKNVLSEKSLCRPVRAWCPLCYEAQRKSEGVIYDYLLWSLSTVEICPFHQRALEERCPHCHRQLHPLSTKSRPGYCCRCEEWLGHSERETPEAISPEELTYKLWVANQMGELIAAAPTMSSDPPQAKVTDFVPACINRISDGNVSAFARLVNVNKITVYSWCYDRAVPQIDLILRVFHATGASLVDILTKQKVFPNFELPGKSRWQVTFTPGPHRHTTGAVRRALLTALKQNPAPALRDVAHNLGYASPDFLYLKYSDLCRKLTARHRLYFGGPHQNLLSKRTYPEDKTIEAALQKALIEPIAPSLRHIARSLGFSSRFMVRYVLNKKFPELCQVILDHRATCRERRRDSIRQKLQAILLEAPPPTLDKATERFGYKKTPYLRKYHSDLCSAIVRRHAEYRKAQFDGLGDKLDAILHEEAPSSLRAAAKRLGRNPCYLSSRFPDVCQAIAKRNALLLAKQRLEKKKEAAINVRRIALQLHSVGVYPSLKRIKRSLKGPQGVTNTEAGDILRELRRELKLLPPSRTTVSALTQ
jgi:predicted metal-dependent hydrolase